jgi:hypothetical protein
MDAMLRPIRMDTTLPGLMSMPILDPMSMPIHLGIMSPIITPIERKVLSTGVACDIRTQELEKGGRSSGATFPSTFDQANLTDRKPMDGDGDHLTGTHLVRYCHTWHNGKP